MSDSESWKGLERKAAHAKVSKTPVSEFMTQSVLNLSESTKIYHAIQGLKVHKISGAPVVDSLDRLVGIVSEHDLLMQAAIKDLGDNISYIKDVFTFSPETVLQDVLVVFYKKKYRIVPVVDKKKKLLGIVSRLDVLEQLIESGRRKSGGE